MAAVKIAIGSELANERLIYSVLPADPSFSQIRDSVRMPDPLHLQTWTLQFIDPYARSFSNLANELRNKLEDDFPLHRKLSLTLMFEAISAVKKLHDVSIPDFAPTGIAHASISPECLKISADGKVKLYNFEHAQADDGEELSRMDWHYGARGYEEPNASLIGGHEFTRKQADAYALGVVLNAFALPGEVSTGEMAGTGAADEVARIETWRMHVAPNDDRRTDKLTDLIRSLTHEVPNCRPSLDTVLQHPEFTAPGAMFSQAELAEHLRELGLLADPSAARP